MAVFGAFELFFVGFEPVGAVQLRILRWVEVAQEGVDELLATVVVVGRCGVEELSRDVVAFGVVHVVFREHAVFGHEHGCAFAVFGHAQGDVAEPVFEVGDGGFWQDVAGEVYHPQGVVGHLWVVVAGPQAFVDEYHHYVERTPDNAAPVVFGVFAVAAVLQEDVGGPGGFDEVEGEGVVVYSGEAVVHPLGAGDGECHVAPVGQHLEHLFDVVSAALKVGLHVPLVPFEEEFCGGDVGVGDVLRGM